MYSTIISTKELAQHIGDPDWVVVDCRFQPADTEAGRIDYGKSHIPGAVYAHLDENLAAPIEPGITGRHPLPSPEKMAETLSGWGIGPETQVVTYDDAGGAMAASRLWWMLKWLGHDAVAVLDGGWSKWVGDGREIESSKVVKPSKTFVPHPRSELQVSTEDVEEMLRDESALVIDARSRERYLGEVEPWDPIAGHIPGAISAPFAELLTPENTLLSVDEIRSYFNSLLGDVPPEKVVYYCGSGVTSILSILAMEYAGIGMPKLYVGSWSQWITDPARGVATK
jgi:thiosulfate/3-mercaptopyruvate sulfurtransferase